MVAAHTPTAILEQETESLTAQLAAAKKAREEFDASGDKGLEHDAARAQMIEREKKLAAELAAAQDPARVAQTARLTGEQRGVRSAELGAKAADYGIDEADKLLRVRKQLTDDIAQTEERLADAEKGSVSEQELIGRKLKDQELLFQNQLDVRRRAADVEREIHQLAIDQNREFAKSFFGSGPAEMLRKLAAFRLAMGGGISQGRLFSMSPGMRQDVGQLTGMNPQMFQLLNERNRLGQTNLPGFAGGGYTGDGPSDEVAGVVHKGEVVIPKHMVDRNAGVWDRPRSLAADSPFSGPRSSNRVSLPMPAPKSSATDANDEPPRTAAEWAAYDQAQRNQRWEALNQSMYGGHAPTTPEGWAAHDRTARDQRWEALNQSMFGGHAPTTPEGWAAHDKAARDRSWEALNQSMYGGHAPTTPEGWAEHDKSARMARFEAQYGGGRWRQSSHHATDKAWWTHRQAQGEPHRQAQGGQHPVHGTEGTHGTNGAPVPRAMVPSARTTGGTPVPHGPQEAQTDDTAVKNATAALNLLAAGANRVTAAFAALASRADALFNKPGGMQFAPAGQVGGWYPGKQG
jgi:hypothetical protein